MVRQTPSSAEWLEVVDEGDRVTSLLPRAEIHRLGLRHRSAHILLFDRTGRVFLQRRSRHKDVNAGLWDTSAAGHVDPGESYDDCARRELSEELGIACPTEGLERLFKLDASAMTGWEFIQVYRTVHDGPLRLNPDEIEEGRWLRPEEIDEWKDTDGSVLSETFRDIWTRFRKRAPDH